MTKYVTREQLCKVALNFSDTYKYLLLEWATRVGKTPAAIGVVKRNPGRWNIVVAETVHIHQWKEEFKKFHAQHLLKYIDIFCYQSLHKHKDDEGVNWVFDEAHHMFSEKRWEIISNIKAMPRAIFLSATLESKQKIQLRQHFSGLAEHRFSLQKAIDNKILPQPNIVIIGLSLGNEPTDLLWQMYKGKQLNAAGKVCNYSDRWKYYLDPINKDLLLHVRCTQKEYYYLLNADYINAKTKYEKLRSSWNHVNWLKKGLERKRFLASLKTKEATKLVEFLGDKRFICFTSSVKQGMQLGGDQTVHSGRHKKENQEIIEKFNSGKKDQLFAIGMLQEGINLEGLDAGIILQLDGKVRSFIQKSGRTLLAQMPEQYIIYIKGTRDEYYLEQAMKEVDTKYVYKVNSVDELTK